jgi:Na+/H+ antiporter NhaC
VPAALVILAIYFVIGGSVETQVATVSVDWQLIMPYLLVIVLAVVGLNVLLVLLIGIVAAFVVGIAT